MVVALNNAHLCCYKGAMHLFRHLLERMRSLALVSFSAIVITLASLVAGQDKRLSSVKRAFAKADIPEDAHITFEPNTLLEVMFPQTSSRRPALVKAGVQLQRNQTAIPPRFGIKSVTASQRKETFVVSMVDLDAPTPQNPNVSQIRHFLGANFHLGEPNRFGVSLLSNSTPALSDFLQPTPPAGSDPHRYVFLLFVQPSNFNKESGNFVNASTPVTDFSISTFAKEVGLGNPLGGSFIRVGPDPSD